MTRTTDHDIDGLALTTIGQVQSLIVSAQSTRTRRERANRRRFAGLFRDPDAIDVTIMLTDEVMRVASVRSAAAVLREAAHRSTRRGFGAINATGLRLVAALARLSPRVAVAVVHERVRGLARDLVLPAEPGPLHHHLSERAKAGARLNINVLGEAVLGEREAHERLERVLEMIRRPEVTYVSVKISSVVSQLITLDVDGSVERAAQRLRRIFAQARDHGVFINLDMEEFRDLRFTLDVFMRVLSEPDFDAMAAGIVLQAYLPEAHAAFEELVAWSGHRQARTGALIKIRLVKGANLAMEHAEAELHGWTAAPFATKSEVDASYARLLDVALRPDVARSVRIGVASHNLFHVTWAIAIAQLRGVQEQLDIEMLEGMANAEALSIIQSGRPVLLYAPVTSREDFAAAVAYLVRRLDENTSDENYLKAAFTIADNAEVFAEQRDRFVRSTQDRHALDCSSRRHVDALTPASAAFANEPDGDPTNPRYASRVREALARVLDPRDAVIPLVLDGDVKAIGPTREGTDPSANANPWYRYRVATSDEVDQAVAAARASAHTWSGRDAGERRRLLLAGASSMADARATTIAVMARDTGKTVGEADPEVSEAIDFARFYAAHAHDHPLSSAKGVVLVTPPWNFPYAIAAGGVCAALAAGNAVIVKPAPEAVAVAWELVQHLWAGGVDRDVLQFVPTDDDEVGRHLVTHDGVDAVILTGAFDTAKQFLQWRPRRTVLAETSGKNAVLISSFADVDLAVKDLVTSAFGHAGQKCSAASLGIVEASVYAQPGFRKQLVDAVTSLCVGPGYDLATTMGPLIRPPETTLHRALTQLDPGESWLVEPRQLDEVGCLWSPGVKTGVQPGSWSHQHEWFGPVLALMVAPDFATALQWQNDVPYGLTAGLQSLDQRECEQWIDAVEAGNLYVNRGTTGAVVQRQPFGGWKRSSVGPTAKAGGEHYVDALRDWDEMTDVGEACASLRSWMDREGARALDRSALSVERDVQRFRPSLGRHLVRVDERCTADQARYIRTLAEFTGARVDISCATKLPGLEVTVETGDELVRRAVGASRCRWLSAEVPPVTALLDLGISTDLRPLAQNGAVEGPRWLLEQSVAVTHHRYGNVHAGPKPLVHGLDSSMERPSDPRVR